ncbi:MAG TPA: deoxyribose-phosphate aldolase [Spirochaetota bacterium]|nr:deoxyribose-phosphate aldolase [Spirochaetota bacterium]HOL56356.1 deoxyribose-phosphate aldolase [Spirochaetota bacterium]HPP03854.1 deoxyribose-phosphate aldolase [Spirochaetota bacterium]
MKIILSHNEALSLLNEGKIEKLIDNTLLKLDATEKEIEDFIFESLKYNFHSICIHPCWLEFAKALIKNNMQLTTVIGFPLGATTTKTKCNETEESLSNGATEIDMVINIGFLKSKKYKRVEEEIKKIRSICSNFILKIIIEASLLTKDEIINITKISEECDADFIKTSTGFAKEGARIEDIEIIKNSLSNKKIGIKASGGIKNLEILKNMIYAGATRIGTSNGIKIIKEFISEGN